MLVAVPNKATIRAKLNFFPRYHHGTSNLSSHACSTPTLVIIYQRLDRRTKDPGFAPNDRLTLEGINHRPSSIIIDIPTNDHLAFRQNNTRKKMGQTEYRNAKLGSRELNGSFGLSFLIVGSETNTFANRTLLRPFFDEVEKKSY